MGSVDTVGTVPQAGPPKYVAASCPAPSNEPGARAVGPFGGAGGAIPAGFQPAWVLSCPIELRDMPGQGQWQVQLTERADLDAAQAVALLTKLRQPSDAAGPDQICTADGVVWPYYALVDAHGTAIEPAIPVNGCGKPKFDVAKVLGELPYRELSTRPEAPVG